MEDTTHRPALNEKIFFLISGAILSAPFPFLVNSLASYFLHIDLPDFYASLISTAFIAPILEEFTKALPLFYRHGETEKSLMTLGFLTGIGFGVVEFLFYVFALHSPFSTRIPAIFFHASNTAIVSYGIGKKQTARFYLIAVGLHLLNNLFAIYGKSWWIGGAAVTLVSYLFAWTLFSKASEKNIEQ